MASALLAVAVLAAACGGLTRAGTRGSTGGAEPRAGSGAAGSPGPEEPVACPGDPEGTALPAGPDAPVSRTACPGDREPPPPSSQPATPRPGATDVRPLPWDRVEVANDGRTLTVYFTIGVEPCYVLDRVEVRERPDAVVITLYQGTGLPDAEGVACIEIAVLKHVVVELARPLGDRRVVDGAEKGRPEPPRWPGGQPPAGESG